MALKTKSPATAKKARESGPGAHGTAPKKARAAVGTGAAPATQPQPAATDKASTAARRKPRTTAAKRSPSAPPTKAEAAASRMAALKAVVVAALDDMKALEVKLLDVRGLTDVADTMVIASGTSDRHVRSVAQNVIEKAKAAGLRPHGVEGQQDGEWVLIDLNEMIVHVMLPRVREFYGLEKLWDMTATKRAARA